MSRKYTSDPSEISSREKALEQLIGLGPRSMQKSYYPELRTRLDELTRFRNLLDNVNDLIILINLPSCEIIDVNKTTESLLGISADSMVGRPLSSMMNQDQAVKIAGFFRQQYICSTIIRTSLITRFGKQIPVEINCKIVPLKPSGYGVLIARNITDQEKARQELEIQRAFFRQLFDNSPKAIALSSENFKVVDINNAFTDLFGYSKDELLDRELADFIIPSDLTAENQDLRQKALQGERLSLETRRKARDGTAMEVELQLIPVSFDGSFKGFFCIYSDLTAKIQTERAMARRQKLESISLMAGGLAHDFNNILSVILANTSICQNRIAQDSSLRENLGRIENASIRARDLTRQLMTFARGGEPVMKVFDLKALLHETVNFSLSGSTARVELTIDPDLKHVHADPGQISQVIQNLVINADQAMHEHGLLKIKAANTCLSAENPWSLKQGEYIFMEFRDNGPGIREQDLSRVFDPYFTTKQKGSGLGLAVVYSIIRKHQGHISVHSSPGKGALFTVLLQATSDQPEAEKSEEQTGRSGARILILDDEPDILEVTAEYLQEQGYIVETAEQGREAVDKYLEAGHKGQPFDLLITDLTIPGGLGGKEVVQALKDHDPGLTAVVSSGYPNDPVMARHQEFGFAAKIVKPFRMQELDRVIRHCLTSKTPEDSL